MLCVVEYSSNQCSEHIYCKERVGWRGPWDVSMSCWAVWILNAIKHLWQQIPCWSPLTFLSLHFLLYCNIKAWKALDLLCWYFFGRFPCLFIQIADFLLIDHLTITIIIYLSDLWRKGQFSPELHSFSSDWSNFYLMVQFTHNRFE